MEASNLEFAPLEIPTIFSTCTILDAKLTIPDIMFLFGLGFHVQTEGQKTTLNRDLSQPHCVFSDENRHDLNELFQDLLETYPQAQITFS